MTISSFAPTSPDIVADFKQAMRRLTSTVAILTTERGGERFGMTVTAVCSLGIAPPTLIVSIAHTASMHGPVLDKGRIAVNLLRETHRDMVADFAGRKKGEARFAGRPWKPGAHDLPVLESAQASLLCKIVSITQFNGHSVLFIEVEDVILHEAIEPLLYQNGRVAGAHYLEGDGA